MADDKSGKPPPLMGATAIRPPERHGMEKYTHMLYDPKNGTFLTRTPKSWALITLFYCIYYSCLAGFWMACMTIFLKIQIQVPSSTNPNAKPTWVLQESIIGKNPGLGVRPAQTIEEVDSGIFALDNEFSWDKVCSNENVTLAKLEEYGWRNANDAYIDECIKKDVEEQGEPGKEWKRSTKYTEGSKGYAYRAWEFLKIYRENDKDSKNKHKDAIDCTDADLDKETGYRTKTGKFCHFDLDNLAENEKIGNGEDRKDENGNIVKKKTGCHAFPYGYDKNHFEPCIFLKFNRIMGLEPIPLNTSNFNKQDESLRKDKSSRDFMTAIDDAKFPNKVLVNCEGDYPADKEILVESMNLMPKDKEMKTVKHGAKIDLSYFPYDKYRVDKDGNGFNENPLIAIQFKNLDTNGMMEDRLIHIVCKAYYDGVVHSKKDKAGLVKFEVRFRAKKAKKA